MVFHRNGPTNTPLARSADRDYGVNGDGGVAIERPATT